MDWHEKLKEINACNDAQKWAKDYTTIDTAWAACERGDWMLWLIGKTDKSKPWSDERKPLVLCSCEVARTSLPYTKDARVLTCVETTEAWCKGEATQEQTASAALSAESAALSAAWSARSAWSAALSARSAALSARSAESAWSATSSAYLKLSADIVRKHYPKPPQI